MKNKTPLKGKAIVGQSGGCTAVINESLGGVIEAAGKPGLITHLWGARHAVEGILKGDFCDLFSQPTAQLKKICALPSAALGSSRYRLRPGDEKKIVDNLRKWNVRYLFLVGGNDTADTILKIARACESAGHEIRVVHVPKTIDNDLLETDHTPGFGSVARFVAVTTQEAGLDTRSMRHVDPVKIIEVMGRNAGWIVAASALLKKSRKDPPHLLLFPEVPFHEKRFLRDVGRVLREVGYCVIVISETIRDAKGMRLGARTKGITHDSFGHQYVEGASSYLARLVEDRFKLRARYDKPGTIQRMSIPYRSTVDQKEAREAGRCAVRWALKGMTRVMVGFKRKKSKGYQIEYVPVPLDLIPNREKLFPLKFFNSERNGISKAFRNYALPLLGPDLPDFPVLK